MPDEERVGGMGCKKEEGEDSGNLSRGSSFSWNSADVNVFWLGPVNRDGEDRFLKEKVFVEKRFDGLFFPLVLKGAYK